MLLSEGPLPLALQPAPLGAASGLGGAPRDGWDERLAQEGGQALPGCLTVAELGAVLHGIDREHGAVEPVREPIQHALALRLGEGGGGGEVQAQLHPGIRGVHTLPSGTGGVRELLDELCGGDAQAARSSGAGRHHEIARGAHRGTPTVTVSPP